MEAAASVAAARSGSLTMSSSSRKEWRAISEHHPVRNHADEVEIDRSKMGQSNERTIYEVQHGRELADVNFSITADESLDDDILQQQIHNITRQREELLQMEVKFRAQAIARSRVLEMQSSCDAKIAAHANAVAMLEEQLHEREQTIHDLERKMEEKDRKLQAIKVDKEESWAKDDLLREQNKKLATFRREHDHSEAERAQHIKQMQDLQEHLQEKERQFIELQEQYRAAQEAILYRDEQLGEAQTWISRVQEMDALQSSTNHSLQAELRERTEQYNQLWHGCQRQFAEMERLHSHTIHQLQLELADVRERNGSYTDESHMSQRKSKDLSQFVQNKEQEVDSNGSGAENANTAVISTGASDNVKLLVSASNDPNPNDHVPSVPIAPVGMSTYFPPGQVSALHSFIMQQQGVQHSVASHVGPYTMPDLSSIQQWQNQMTSSEGLQLSAQDHKPTSQTEQDVTNEYDMSVNGQTIRTGYLEHVSKGSELSSVISSSSGKAQVESENASYLVDPQPEPTLPQVSSQFHEALILNSESKEQNILNMNNHVLEDQILTAEETSTVASASPSHDTVHSVDFCDTTVKNGTVAFLPEKLVSTGQSNYLISAKTSETALLDERSLLACVVRTIPNGGRIRISSTLPNRLGKMLSPLHWHDYKKLYGKLDDFVAAHPELFLIEGDYIRLREGAQEMIAAIAAVAKVAAAAAASSPYSPVLPSVAVTPMAQPNRLKKGLPSAAADSNHAKNENASFKGYAVISKNAADDHSQLLEMKNQHPNGISFGVAGNLSDVKILSKPNGANFERSSASNVESKASGLERSNSNFSGKQRGRATGAALSS
ncbi:putative leucine-rich repeat-containing protein DDB_G0290503 isoform X2 [Hibiscus syriacus]|uniref:putative leucine-rich repeat-containing protein DDB_G0290503 isoform X2 n=1 Tax=Hibiscus syriacus TaxID=106335 RepID=UPI0019214C81|nr:putative leucine-rich repeat-containing protein DDB_G0290503 isoform X2 [Hibiscus syriacus]